MNEALQPFELQREALAEKLKLHDQWEDQVKTLNETGVLKILPEAKDIGVIGIDGKEYPIPKYDEILSKITPETMEFLEKKTEQGFSNLLLVPMAISLDTLIDRYKRELLKHAEEGKLFSTDKTLELNSEDPLYVWEEYKKANIEKRLVYYPQRFNKENHQGKTKQEIIDQGDAWEIRFVEEIVDIPAQGQGQTLAGRKQLETNQTPNEYLKMILEDPQYQKEQGLTPESWLTYAISRLHQANQQIDDYQGKGKLCYLLGSYLPAGSGVPCGCFRRGDRRADLCGCGPDDHYLDSGFRSSVKI